MAALIRATFGQDMRAAQNGRELETSASFPLKSMAGLTRLGAILLCSAFTDVRRVGEVWLSPSKPSIGSLPYI